MKTIQLSLLVLAFLAATNQKEAIAFPADDPRPAHKKDATPKPKFTISKETTYVTGSFDKEGYGDYAAALNERLAKGVTPGNNANVQLWWALGPQPEGRTIPPEFFQLMGVPPPLERGDYFIDFSSYAKTRSKIGRGNETPEKLHDQLNRAGKRSWKSTQYPLLAGWLRANDKAMTVAFAATKRTRFFSPLVPPRDKEGASTDYKNRAIWPPPLGFGPCFTWAKAVMKTPGKISSPAIGSADF